MCDNILVNCKKAWDFQIGADTYALIVWGFGSENTTATITEVLWSIPEKTEETTGANRGDNSKGKHIDSGSGSEESDDNSESKSSKSSSEKHGKKKKKERKLAKKERKTKRKEQLRQRKADRQAAIAKKNAKQALRIIASGTKMLDTAIARLTSEMEDKVPEYVRKGATTVLAELKTSEALWKQIAEGKHVEKVNIDDAKKLSTKANNHQKAVDSMVDSALQMMADEARSEGKRPKKR